MVLIAESNITTGVGGGSGVDSRVYTRGWQSFSVAGQIDILGFAGKEAISSRLYRYLYNHLKCKTVRSSWSLRLTGGSRVRPMAVVCWSLV